MTISGQRLGEFALAVGLLAISAAGVAADLSLRVTDAAGRGLPDAVVYLLPDVLPPPETHARAVIDQVNRQFQPRVSVVQTGTEISFPNSDNIRHSVYSFSQAKAFTLKLYAGTPSSPIRFDRPGLVVLGCNIHDNMAAWVMVVDTPYFGRASAAGAVTFHAVPPGHYRMVTWYPTLEGDAPSRSLDVGTGITEVPVIRLPVTVLGEQAP